MQGYEIDDAEIERISRELVEFQEDPSTWNESVWRGGTDPLMIWEWAENHKRMDILSLIADSVASQVTTRTRNDPADEKYQYWNYWDSKFVHLAEEAKSRGSLEMYASFLEASLHFSPSTYTRLEKIENILSAYINLHKPEKIAFYLTRKSTELNSLYVMGRLDSDEDEIWKLLIEAYGISKDVQFYKGIALALLGLGEYLGRKRKDRLALKFLYQAKIFAYKARTKFGISVLASLRKIRDRSNVSAKIYEIEINPDLLIDEFIRKIDTQQRT